MFNLLLPITPPPRLRLPRSNSSLCLVLLPALQAQLRHQAPTFLVQFQTRLNAPGMVRGREDVLKLRRLQCRPVVLER